MASKKKKVIDSVVISKHGSRSKVSQALTKKLESGKLEYQQQMGGWIREVTAGHKNQPSLYKRLCDTKQQQKSNQMKSEKKIKEHASSQQFSFDKHGSTASEDKSDEESDSGNEEDVDVEELINLKPRVSSPFKSAEEFEHEVTSQLALWNAPQHRRDKSFAFVKPTNKTSDVKTCSLALVQRLHRALVDKDKQIGILRKQLLKIHEESGRLVEQVARQKGPDAVELRKENDLLKEQLQRCRRANAILKGFQLQSRNSTFKRLKQKEALDEHSYQCRHSRPHSTRPFTSCYQPREKQRAASARTCP